jgi:hypothetical protein
MGSLSGIPEFVTQSADRFILIPPWNLRPRRLSWFYGVGRERFYYGRRVQKDGRDLS